MLKELIALGLSNYEARVIETLSKGKFDLRNLSRKSGVPFGKIYSIVKVLKEKGFVNESNTRPKLIYINNFSEIIGVLIREKQDKERNVLENIREIAVDIDKDICEKKGRFFDIGIDIEDNKRIQLRSFQEAEEEVFQILNVYHKPESNRRSKTIWEKEIENAINRGVVFKSIYPCDVILPDILKKLCKEKGDKFQVKRFDTYFTRCDIIDRKKVLIKLVHEDATHYGGVIFIEDEKFAENLIKIFDEMWGELFNSF